MELDSESNNKFTKAHFAFNNLPQLTYDDVPPWYEGNPEIAERNARLKERMLKAQAKRDSQQESS